MSLHKSLRLSAVLLCFFTMGFVDLVGIATNYVQKDLGLTDAEANLFPSLVLPLFGESYGLMLATFSLLGIGNALMQTSLNPLVSNVVSKERLTSTLTFGQFVKAIASFVAPLLAAWGAMGGLPVPGLGWRTLFAVYGLIAVGAVLVLSATPIREQEADEACGVGSTLSLLRQPFVFLAFCGILCHVGIDVGTNTTAPRLLMERAGLSLETAGLATSIYFVCRTVGCLAGSALMQRIQPRLVFGVSCVAMVVALVSLALLQSEAGLYVSIGLVGLANSNIFPIIFAAALNRTPRQANAVSALMIMGLFGGTIFPLLMGVASDAVGQQGAVAVMAFAAVYLSFLATRLQQK